MPYRESMALSMLRCPRCGKPLPPGDMAACTDRCGIWVGADSAITAFEGSELRPSRVPSWFRALVGCPACHTRMGLRGHDMALFQGCDEHGYFVDEDAVAQTGLGRLSVAERVKQARLVASTILVDIARAAQRERDMAIARERERLEHEDAVERERVERETAILIERAERERERVAERARREAAVRPYAEKVRALLADDDILPLAEELQRLDAAIAALTARLDVLERGRNDR